MKKLGEVAKIYQPETISQSKYKYNRKFWQDIIACKDSTCETVPAIERKGVDKDE